MQVAEIHELNSRIEAIREVISNIDKEINESGASVANLRENIRVRKLVDDIEKTQTEIDSYDMEEAARARRNFEEKYNLAKQKETDLQATVSHDSTYSLKVVNFAASFNSILTLVGSLALTNRN